METVPEAVDSETSTEVEKSDTTEATLSTSKVETPDISRDNGISSEATADASSDTSVATNEDRKRIVYTR